MSLLGSPTTLAASISVNERYLLLTYNPVETLILSKQSFNPLKLYNALTGQKLPKGDV